MYFKKKIYVSHPFKGLLENQLDVENKIKSFTSIYPEYLFISPLHTFGFLYNETDYDQGMKMCIELLNLCDEMWLCGDWKHSIGCRKEIEFCKTKNIPFKESEEYNE